MDTVVSIREVNFHLVHKFVQVLAQTEISYGDCPILAVKYQIAQFQVSVFNVPLKNQ